jgi:hypothetical protein
VAPDARVKRNCQAPLSRQYLTACISLWLGAHRERWQRRAYSHPVWSYAPASKKLRQQGRCWQCVLELHVYALKRWLRIR